MIYQVVSVHDRAAAAFGRPIFVASLGQAIRSFQDELNRNAPDNQMHHHPDDFDMFHLGTFNEENGTFTNLDEPDPIAIGKQLITKGA